MGSARSWLSRRTYARLGGESVSDYRCGVQWAVATLADAERWPTLLESGRNFIAVPLQCPMCINAVTIRALLVKRAAARKDAIDLTVRDEDLHQVASCADRRV